jgi:hypothetical protein
LLANDFFSDYFGLKSCGTMSSRNGTTCQLAYINGLSKSYFEAQAVAKVTMEAAEDALNKIANV